MKLKSKELKSTEFLLIRVHNSFLKSRVHIRRTKEPEHRLDH